MNRPLHGIGRQLAIWTGIGLSALVFQPAVSQLAVAGEAPGPTILQSSAGAGAALVVAASFLAASLIAGVVGRLTNAAVGLFVLGCGVSYLALRCGTLEDLAFAAGASLKVLAIETLAWAIMLCVGGVIVFRFAGPLADVMDGQQEGGHDDGRGCAWSGGAWIGALMGAAVIPVVWLVARSQMKGQVLAAVVIGAIAAGLAARLLRPNAWPILLFAAPCVFGGLAQLVWAFMARMPLDAVYVQQALAAPLLAMPIDYAAGSLVGVSLGLGWGRSFAHGEEAHPRIARTESCA